MTTFIATTVADIDAHLDAAREEIRLLTEARKALGLDGEKPARERPARRSVKATPAQSGKSTAAAERQEAERLAGKLSPRQVQALALIEAKPGITSAELSNALGSTHAYAIVRKLRSVGEIQPCEKGWQTK